MNATTGVITTVAGNGTAGYSGDGGLATSAELHGPTGVAVDSSGNLYIADSTNHVIREVNHSTGDISTFAGNGTAGSSGNGGLATSAELNDPYSVAADSAGDIYVSDLNNYTVREVSHSTGDIAIVAGNGTDGYSGDGGPATSAEISVARQIAVDSSGNLYIADTANEATREVSSSTGTITTLASRGAAAPYGVAVDSSGNVYFGDYLTNKVGKISASPLPISFSPATLTYATTNVDTRTSAQSVTIKNTQSSSLSISSDAVSGADSGDFSIAVDGCSGAVLLSNATCSVSVAFTPTTVGPRSADLTFSDGISSGLHYVYLIGEASGYVSTLAGTGTAGNTGDGSPALSAEVMPTGTAVDSSGDLYVVSYNEVREISASTGLITRVAGTGTAGYSGDGGLATSAKLSGPTGLAFDSSNNLYIADEGNERIREVHTSTGIISTIAGNGTTGYSGDGGLATSAEFDDPSEIAFDGSGDLYIADALNHVVREINHSTGDISTVAGNGTSGDSGDGGPSTSAELKEPYSLAVDSAGDLFISDYLAFTVREVKPRDGRHYNCGWRRSEWLHGRRESGRIGRDLVPTPNRRRCFG